MKKILSVFLIVLLLASFMSGCGCKHEWEDATCEDPETCEKCGETRGETGDHKWKDATCKRPKTCKTCGKTKGKPVDHKWQNDICTKCGASLLDSILSSGKLTVATSPDYPPFESLEDGKVVGIEVDIMALVCADLGVELEFEQMDFDSVLNGIQAAKYNCAASGITVTPTREKDMLFTAPYYSAAQVIVVREGSAIKAKADLEGKTVSVQTGTTAEWNCQDAGLVVWACNSDIDAKVALTTGKVDAWVVDGLTARLMVKEGEDLVILSETLYEENYAFAFPKGSEALVAKINPILERMIADGTVARIFAKYGEAY